MSKNKSKLIKEEENRLLVVFEDVDQDRMTVIRPLIQNSAFMKITLDGLQEEINTKGYSDSYQNGANQSGTKASAELQAYNSLIKNYNTVQHKLIALLPEKAKQENKLNELFGKSI